MVRISSVPSIVIKILSAQSGSLSSVIYGLDFHLEEKIHKGGSPASLRLKKSTSTDESKDSYRTRKNVKTQQQQQKVIDPKH